MAIFQPEIDTILRLSEDCAFNLIVQSIAFWRKLAHITERTVSEITFIKDKYDEAGNNASD